ncbi:aldo/keto reductase [Geotalea toluenoxydans]|uniref:aldo/keto reductase n=1 Tax=Geotalea toluenoxydans TaxID=421624 RepID=UPI000A544F5C|nr:aldo/keto reductase [Geotalea toluenoxydans]
MISRRQFNKQSIALVAGLAAGHLLSPMLHAEMSRGNNGMIYRALGRTGEHVSIIGLGGWHIGQLSLSEHESIQLIRQAIDRGITFMDNCWDYNEGVSQVRMGKALKDATARRSS